MDSSNSNIQRQRDTASQQEPVAALSTGTEQYHVPRTQTREQQTVLCVDKDEESRAVWRQALAGYEVIFACGAYEALRNINARLFDLYALEYWLPDWSGPSLCRDIRKEDPHVPVCFCSSADTAEAERRARRAGATAYVLKPAHPEVLKTEISVIMQAAARRSATARIVAFVAIQKELEKRFAALSAVALSDDIQRALKRSARSKAKEAFLSRGGTLAAFERIWELSWKAAWRERVG